MMEFSVTDLNIFLQKADIESKRMEGMLQIVMLKKLNRLAHIRCKKVRDGTSEVSYNDFHLFTFCFSSKSDYLPISIMSCILKNLFILRCS